MLFRSDLSAAFDTVDTELLLYRLRKFFGIQGAPLGWISSFLSDRTQQVVYRTSMSASKELNCGVPQGSVLGPLLFSLYMTELSDIVSRHGLDVHFYADDTQLYTSVPALDTNIAVSKFTEAMVDIEQWLNSSRLKLNADKTQYIWVGTRQQLSKVDISHIDMLGTSIQASTTVKDLGVLLDGCLTMTDHIRSMSKSSFFQL